MTTRKRVRFFVNNQDITVQMPFFSLTPEDAFSRHGDSPGIGRQVSEVTRYIPASDLVPIASAGAWGWKRN